MSACIIETNRLCLRSWLPTDIPLFIAMNKDLDVMQFFPKTLTDAESISFLERINLSFSKNGFGLFAVEEKITKEFLGFTGFSIPTFKMFFTPCVEIGWRFKKESWGKGFATEAALACLEYGVQKLGFNRIVSFTSTINKRSELVMQRIGMSYISAFNHPGIDRSHPLCEHVLYELLL